MKKKWIFIRGLAREKTHWGDFVEKFQKHNPEAEILLLDLKGNGETYQLKTPASIDGLVEDLRLRSREFCQNHPVQILSVSLGAMVALSWATQYPSEIQKVIAVNTSTSLSPFYKRLKLSSIPILIQIALTSDFAKKEKLALSLVAPKALEKTPSLVNDFAKVHELRPVHSLNFLRQLLAARTMKLAPKPPSVETVLIHSLGDIMVDPSCTVDIARFWGLKTISHPWGGHDLPLEDAEWLIQHM